MSETPPYRPFESVLVANRGEIALRVIRGIKAAGLRAVAIASEADATAPHALAADTCVIIGPGPAKESYLVAPRVLAAARETGCQAIHPGYGFFAENADFARQAIAAGLVWIGPPPEVIDRLGDKLAAKALAREAGVPIAPGYEGAAEDTEVLMRAADGIGFPLLVKAAAGGGGRGMRSVERREDLEGALAAASREAAAAFGSGRVFLERLVRPARHIEVQVFADAHGNVLHLGERECSVQRRYQKVIEESPSPAVNPALRERMGAAAVALTRASHYVGAGTVEFLLAQSGEFYFLEVNTRLQVEHPVTELVTGYDLVALQLAAAMGEPLGFTQDDVAPRGHAIELRVCAEDPAHSFAPQAGRILRLELPDGPGIRVDTGVRSQYEVTSHYDSLLLKLLAYGPDRETAIARARRGLHELVLMGPVTNVEFLDAVLAHEEFAAGNLSTSFIDDHLSDWGPTQEIDDIVALIAAAGEMLMPAAGVPSRSGGGGDSELPTAWETLPGWRPSGQSTGRASGQAGGAS